MKCFHAALLSSRDGYPLEPKSGLNGVKPPVEFAGLISFRMEWLDLLAVQGTLKSLL